MASTLCRQYFSRPQSLTLSSSSPTTVEYCPREGWIYHLKSRILRPIRRDGQRSPQASTAPPCPTTKPKTKGSAIMPTRGPHSTDPSKETLIIRPFAVDRRSKICCRCPDSAMGILYYCPLHAKRHTASAGIVMRVAFDLQSIFGLRSLSQRVSAIFAALVSGASRGQYLAHID